MQTTLYIAHGHCDGPDYVRLFADEQFGGETFRVRHYRKCHLFLLRIFTAILIFLISGQFTTIHLLKGGTLNSVHSGRNQCIRGFGHPGVHISGLDEHKL